MVQALNPNRFQDVFFEFTTKNIGTLAFFIGNGFLHFTIDIIGVDHTP